MEDEIRALFDELDAAFERRPRSPITDEELFDLLETEAAYEALLNSQEAPRR